MQYNFVVTVRILWTPISIVLADYITTSDKPYLITIKSVIQDLNIAVNKIHKPLAKVVKSLFSWSGSWNFCTMWIYYGHDFRFIVALQTLQCDISSCWGNFLLIFKVIIQKMQKHIQRFVILNWPTRSFLLIHTTSFSKMSDHAWNCRIIGYIWLRKSCSNVFLAL